MSFQVTIGGVNYDALENRVTIDDNAERRSTAIIHIFDDKAGGSFFQFEAQLPSHIATWPYSPIAT